MLSEYMRCPLRYKYIYIDREQRKLTRFYYRLGSAIHSVLAEFVRLDVNCLTFENLRNLLEKKWNKEWFDNAQEENKWLAHSITMLTNFYSSPYRNKAFTALELAFKTKVDGFLLQGRVDRIDKHPTGEYEIIEYKIGHEEVQEDISLAEKSLQPIFYYYGLLNNYNVLPSFFTFYFLLPNKRVSIEFKDIDINESMESIKRIAKTMTQLGEYPPKTNLYCQDCPFVCPLRTHKNGRK